MLQLTRGVAELLMRRPSVKPLLARTALAFPDSSQKVERGEAQDSKHNVRFIDQDTVGSSQFVISRDPVPAKIKPPLLLAHIRMKGQSWIENISIECSFDGAEQFIEFAATPHS